MPITTRYKKKQYNTKQQNAVSFQHVGKSFFTNKKQKMMLFDNLTFNIPDKKITAILGSSGAGKTTTAKIINGLETYSHGKVFINGILLNKKTIQKVRKNTAFVFQNFNLFPHLSVLDNIIFTPIKVYHKNKDAVLNKAKKLLKQFNMEKKINCFPSELSGGQKQRVAIIRALILEPEILIMDEPTASLDPESTHDVIELIKTINNIGITVLIITHDIIVAKKATNFVLMLHGGKCVDFMKTNDFFNSNVKKSFFSNRFLKNCE